MSLPTRSPDPRPARRIKDPRAGIEKVIAEGRCRICQQTGDLSRMHLVSKGQRGDDIDANIVPGCGHGTAGCHAAFDGGQPKATPPSKLSGVPGGMISRLLWSKLTDEERDYCLTKKGEAWCERRFRL